MTIYFYQKAKKALISELTIIYTKFSALAQDRKM